MGDGTRPRKRSFMRSPPPEIAAAAAFTTLFAAIASEQRQAPTDPHTTWRLLPPLRTGISGAEKTTPDEYPQT